MAARQTIGGRHKTIGSSAPSLTAVLAAKPAFSVLDEACPERVGPDACTPLLLPTSWTRAHGAVHLAQ